MESAIEPVFRNLLITLAAGIAGYLVVNRLNGSREQQGRRASAATSFRSKFLAEVGLAYGGAEWNASTEVAIRKAIPSQQLAINEFRIFLGKREQSSFDITWSNYCDYCRSMSYDSFRAERMFPSMQTHTPMHPRDGFILLVNQILAHANQT